MKSEKIKELIEQMSLEEKVSMLTVKSACQSQDIPRLGIPSIRLVDGATGVNSTEMIVDYTSAHPKDTAFDWMKGMECVCGNWQDVLTKYDQDPSLEAFMKLLKSYRTNGKDYLCFPSGINLGATWAPELAEITGRDLGWELRNSGIDVCLGPNVDVMRDPLGGRNYEMYGEDPYLVGEMSSAYIRGLQSTGTAACAKHFIANNQETQREIKDNHISTRTLRELYSPGFVKAVQQAKTKSIMSAYTSINGTFCSFNHMLLTDWLKEEWGFEGMVVSDWGAAKKDIPGAVQAGLDLVLIGPNDMTEVLNKVEVGEISQEVVDNHVYRILKVVFELKEEQERIPAEYEADRMLATMEEVVCEGAVLLKNAEDLLPLMNGEGEKEHAFILWGEACQKMMEYGSGSTVVLSGKCGNLVREMAKTYGEKQVSFQNWDTSADTLLYVATACGGEGADRKSMTLDKRDEDQIKDILSKAKGKGMKTIVVLNVAAPIDMRAWEMYADAILCIFVPGNAGAGAIASMISGHRSPEGRLPVTFPVRYEDSPCFPNFPGEYKDAYYGEGIFVGYRSYEKRDVQTAYPFGFGLNYTSFRQHACENAISWDIRESNKLSVLVQVENIGGRAGAQVIQAYIREENPHLLRPKKELKAFRKVHLQPGEQTEVSLTLDVSDMQCFDDKLQEWVTPIGAHMIYLGTSSSDIFACIPLNIVGQNPYIMGTDTLFREVLNNPKACKIIDSYFPGMVSTEGINIFSDKTLDEAMSMSVISYIPDAVKAREILDQMYAELALL